MRNWGLVITGFYTLLTGFLFTVGLMYMAGENVGDISSVNDFISSFGDFWILILPMVSAQILLLFLSVDTSWRRMKPQRHMALTAGLVGLMLAILVISVVFAIGSARMGDDFLDSLAADSEENWKMLVEPLAAILIWVFWAVMFYLFSKHKSNVIDSAISWLLRGSVLELLIAVPCHLIIRQRTDCCAPVVSAFGIATGIAIMLMAFGPGALLLYQRKLDDYKKTRSPD